MIFLSQEHTWLFGFSHFLGGQGGFLELIGLEPLRTNSAFILKLLSPWLKELSCLTVGQLRETVLG